jgi:hypothetical protein
LNFIGPNFSNESAISSEITWASNSGSIISSISTWGFSSLKFFFKDLVSSPIFSPPLPITNPGLLVDTIIFSPTGVYSILALLIFPFPTKFFIYSLTLNSSFFS